MLRKLHRWVGLALSLLLLVITITGILLVWTPEYIRATVDEANSAVVNDLAVLGKTTDVIISQYPAGQIRLIEFNPRGLGVHKVVLLDANYAWHDQRGRQIETWSSNGRLEDWLLDLHHRFLLGNTIGLNMAGFSGLLLLPLALVGFVLWWPLRKASKFEFWPKSRRYGHIHKSHRNLGVIALIPILLIAITGVILVYPSESASVLLGDPSRQQQRQQTLSEFDTQPSTKQKFETALQLFPQAKIRWVRPPNSGYDKFLVGVQQASSLNRLGKSHIVFDQGIPIELNNAMAQTSDKRLFDFMFPLHTGQLPLWYRLVLTLFGLLMLSTIVVGLWSWTIKPRRSS